MKLKEIEIKNFRGFENLSCDFSEGINVIVGMNGVGKTSLLDAICVGYGQFFSALATGNDRGIQNSEIHLKKSNGHESDVYTMEYQFPVEIKCTIHESKLNERCLSWSRFRNTIKGRTTQVKELREIAKSLQYDVQQHKNIDIPVFGYYGTERLCKNGRITMEKIESLSKTSRLEGYRECMHPNSGYDSFSVWLRNETRDDLDRRIKIIEEIGLEESVIKGKTVKSELIQAITNAVNCVLKPSGWGDIRYSFHHKQVVARHEKFGVIPVSSLSDGVRNMIGMIANIAYRCVRLNPHLGINAVKETYGVILIDEIDMHLHPEWQQLILQDISTAFPNIQFIVTTHSPQVITTVKNDQVRILTDISEAIKPSANTLGEQSNYVMGHVFNVDSKPKMDFSNDLENYLTMIERGQWDTEGARELRSRLNEILGSKNSDLLFADRTIRRKEFLSK